MTRHTMGISGEQHHENANCGADCVSYVATKQSVINFKATLAYCGVICLLSIF